MEAGDKGSMLKRYKISEKSSAVPGRNVQLYKRAESEIVIELSMAHNGEGRIR